MQIKRILIAFVLLILAFSTSAFAHSGRTDSSGGHNCSAKSIAKGLCTGYHYHNGGTTSGNTSTPSKSTDIPTYTAPKEVVPAGAVKISLPSSNIYINNQQVINSNSKYPVVVYKDITYFPMTWNYTQALGLETDWDKDTGFVIRKTDKKPSKLNFDIGTPPSKSYATLPDFNVFINDNWLDNSKEEYPLLVLNDITYFPMTWKFAVEELGLIIKFDESIGFYISK